MGRDIGCWRQCRTRRAISELVRKPRRGEVSGALPAAHVFGRSSDDCRDPTCGFPAVTTQHSGSADNGQQKMDNPFRLIRSPMTISKDSVMVIHDVGRPHPKEEPRDGRYQPNHPPASARTFVARSTASDRIDDCRTCTPHREGAISMQRLETGSADRGAVRPSELGCSTLSRIGIARDRSRNTLRRCEIRARMAHPPHDSIILSHEIGHGYQRDTSNVPRCRSERHRSRHCAQRPDVTGGSCFVLSAPTRRERCVCHR
jgi:hypothetical protein